MNNDLDSWLSSLGFEEEEAPSPEVAQEPTPPVPSVQSVDVPQQPLEQSESQEPVALSNEDFDDILNNYGFSRPEDAQAEEIVEEDEDNRDLDAEEDADWQEAIDSGGIVLMEYNPEETVTQNFEVTITTADSIEDTSTAPLESSPSPINPIDSAASIQEPLIPLNSPTLLMDETTTRFSGAEWFNEIQKQHIIVAGCGGIGSWLILQLARMHPATMVLYDDDRVEAVNMAGQMYSWQDIGKYKVTAMADMISSYTNTNNVFAISQKFTANTEAGDVMICGFDNMEARGTFYRRWLLHVESKPEEERKNCLFLDGRLSMDTLQVFCITGDDTANKARYSTNYLFSDSNADATVCSMKQTTYLACMIGSIMTNLFTNWVANNLNPIIPYDLPFFTEYDAQNMIFKTIK